MNQWSERKSKQARPAQRATPPEDPMHRAPHPQAVLTGEVWQAGAEYLVEAKPVRAPDGSGADARTPGGEAFAPVPSACAVTSVGPGPIARLAAAIGRILPRKRRAALPRVKTRLGAPVSPL